MTKRKYTVTAKVLEANRWKLALARLVEPAIRFRVSERRRTACRANLVKARAVLRAASQTPDGYPKSEIPNSKLEAGNSKLENGDSKIENPISKIQNPPDPSPVPAQRGHPLPKGEGQESMEAEGQKSTGEDSKIETGNSGIENPKSQIQNQKWPDSPAYGTRLTRGLCAVSLRRSARLMGESAAGFDRHVARFLQALGPRNMREHNLARGIAETVWRRLRVFSGQANWERTRLLWVLRQSLQSAIDPATRDQSSMVELATELACGIEEVFSADTDLFDAAGKLNVRLERLTRQWIKGRGGEPRLVQYATSPCARDERLLERSPEAMGNPFLGASAVDAGLASTPGAELAPFPEEWRRSKCETRNSKLEFRNSKLEIRNWKTAGDCPSTRDAESSGLLDTREKLEELWQGATEAIHRRGSNITDNPTCYNNSAGQNVPDAQQNAGAANFEFRISSFDLVDALWRRLNLYRDLAEREAAEVERVLDTKIAGRMGEAFLARLRALPPGASIAAGEDGETAAFLMELVLLFNRVSIGAAPAGLREANDAVSEELRRTLVARFGPNQEFEALRPGYTDSLMKAHRQRRRAELTARLAKADKLEKRRRARSRRAGAKGTSRRPPRPRRPKVTTIQQLQRAEQRYADVLELHRLPRFDDDDSPEEELEMCGGATPEPDTQEKIAALEWSVRFFAALGAGLVKREG